MMDDAGEYYSIERFHVRNLQQWGEALVDLFPIAIPGTCVWENLEDIVQVLGRLSSPDDLCHLLFPTGGGLDLAGAKKSVEPHCIELNLQDLAYSARPLRLRYESFQGEPSWGGHEWDYFRLETGGLAQVGPDPEPGSIRETVAEIGPGRYTDRSMLHRDPYNDDDDESDEEAEFEPRLVTRFMAGVFLIVAKRSPYNLDAKTYDARHNQMPDTEFREYIENNVQTWRELHAEKRQGS